MTCSVAVICLCSVDTFNFVYFTESWDRRENNLKKRGHLLTAAELKRRGITRYDAEMLLSQGFSLPEPRTAASKKGRIKLSAPARFSPRTGNRLVPSNVAATPTSAGGLPKSIAERSVFIRRNRSRRVVRPLRSRTTSRQLEFRSAHRFFLWSLLFQVLTCRHFLNFKAFHICQYLHV